MADGEWKTDARAAEVQDLSGTWGGGGAGNLTHSRAVEKLSGRDTKPSWAVTSALV